MSANYEQPKFVDKRVRFYDGQFLKDQDFIDDQKYHVDRQRRLARALTVSGICEGLTVEVGEGKVTVQPGSAIDEEGRQVVLAQPREVPLGDFLGQTVAITIAYAVVESDKGGAETGGEGSEDRGSEGFRRWYEQPVVKAIEIQTIADNRSEIVLAQVIVGADKVRDETLPSMRQYSGLRLSTGGNSGSGPSFRAAGAVDNELAILSGSLTISNALTVQKESFFNNNIGVGTTPQQGKRLKVLGDAEVEGVFKVEGKGKSFEIPSWQGSQTVITGVFSGKGNGAQIRFEGLSGKGFIDIGNNSVGDFVVEGKVDNALMTIRQNGSVGIGSSTPSAKLAINGGLHVGGDSDPGEKNLLVDGNFIAKATGNTMPDLRVNGKVLIRGSDAEKYDAILELTGQDKTRGSTHGRHAYIVSRANLHNKYATDLGFRVRASGNYKYDDLPDALTIRYDGNIGIGKLNPIEKLEVAGRIKDEKGYVTPVGAIIPFGGKTAPQGWLICDGRSYSRRDYQELYRIIGSNFGAPNNSSFNVPDFRGRFLRGTDNRAGRDPDALSRQASSSGGLTGDNVGSVQEDQFKAHSHSYTKFPGAKGDIASGRYWKAVGSNTGNTGGSETRPKNVYVNFIIKC